MSGEFVCEREECYWNWWS